MTADNHGKRRLNKNIVAAALVAVLLIGAVGGGLADEALTPRDVPAKTIPVPTSVSTQIQALIAAPLRPGWNVLPKSPEEWRTTAAAGADATMRVLPGMRERLHVNVRDTTVAGVHAFLVTPETVSPENQDRLLVHVHGGCTFSDPAKLERLKRF